MIDKDTDVSEGFSQVHRYREPTATAYHNGWLLIVLRFRHRELNLCYCIRVVLITCLNWKLQVNFPGWSVELIPIGFNPFYYRFVAFTDGGKRAVVDYRSYLGAGQLADMYPYIGRQ